MALSKDRVFKAADAYIRAGKIEKAVAEYERWVAENATDWNTIRQVGDLYARIGRNAEAIQKYSQIAEFYQKDGFNVRAIATHKMILRLDPQNEQSLRNLAELQVMQGLVMEAKAQYQALVEFYNKSGQKRRTLEVFRKLVEIDPSDLKIRYKYAEFLDREGKVAEAVAEYLAVADEFINKGLVAEASQILEKGLRIDGGNRSLRSKLAQAASLQGDYPKAIRLLEEIRGEHPRDIELLTRLGEAYMGGGNAEQAEAVFRRLGELEPDNPQHLTRMAEPAIAQGRLDRALEVLTPAVDQFIARREGERAAALLHKILAREPHHIKTLLKLVELHTALQQDSGRISAYSQLCDAYAHQGEYDRAVEVAEKLIGLEPEGAQHRDRLRFLRARGRAPAGEPAPPAPALAEPAGFEQFEPSPEVGEAISASLEPELSLEEEAPAGARAEKGAEVAGALTPEDEEHINEKFTEAEVFVRYGLVEKAVEQLKDLLESFPFHTGVLEKLVEIYKDQGMDREAAEQTLRLAGIYQRQGSLEQAQKLRAEARLLEPALAEAPTEALATEEEMELTLESQAEELEGLPLEAAGVGLPEEPRGAGAEEEIPIAIEEEPSATEGPSLGFAAEPGAPGSEVSTEVSLSEGEQFPIELDLGEGERVPGGADVLAAASEPAEEEVEISVGEGPSPEQPFELPGAEEESPFDFGEEAGEAVDIQIDIPQAVEPPAPPPRSPAVPAAPHPRAARAVAPSPGPALAPAGEIELAELGEVDEYISLGLYEDARDTLRELLKRRPGDRRVLGKIEELGFSLSQLQKEAEAPVQAKAAPSPAAEPSRAVAPARPLQPAPPVSSSLPVVGGRERVSPAAAGVSPGGRKAAESEAFVDLASELSEEIFGTQSAVVEEGAAESRAGPLTDPGLDEIFREFKKGVEKQLGSEDYDTRYNLGIAYKEMGLLDEAIAEFQLASKDESRLLECCSMLGLCFVEKGMPEIAIKWFEKGLKAPGRTDEEYHGLRYDLAAAHEAAGALERALELYMDIYRVNARFRDVGEKVRELQAAKK